MPTMVAAAMLVVLAGSAGALAEEKGAKPGAVVGYAQAGAEREERERRETAATLALYEPHAKGETIERLRAQALVSGMHCKFTWARSFVLAKLEKERRYEEIGGARNLSRNYAFQKVLMATDDAIELLEADLRGLMPMLKCDRGMASVVYRCIDFFFVEETVSVFMRWQTGTDCNTGEAGELLNRFAVATPDGWYRRR